MRKPFGENKMGRPLHKKFFGNTTLPGQNLSTGGLTGVGSNSVSDIQIANSGTGYTTSTTFNLVFTAPNINGGVAPTGTATSDATGVITSVSLLTKGTGYLSAPVASVNFATSGTTASFAVSLNMVRTLNATANINGVTASVDIMKQEGSHRYMVQNANGIATCSLVASDTLSAGQMNLIAADASDSTYFVTKLTARKAILVNRTNTSTAVVTGGVSAWTVNQPSGSIVTLAPILEEE